MIDLKKPYLSEIDPFIGACESPTLKMQKFPMLGQGGIELATINEFARAMERCKTFFKDSPLPHLPGSVSFTARSGGRLLVNHCGGVVENSGLALHHTFGYPIIPGSALKGISAAAARMDVMEDKGKYEQYLRVWGNTEKNRDEKKEHLGVKDANQAGSVVFYMAIPVDNNWKIVPDVLTAHKSDIKNPVPVFFPAIEAGVTFRFVVAPRNANSDFAKSDVDFAVKYLKTALTDYGVGAKTTSGYGWFCNVKDEEGKQ